MLPDGWFRSPEGDGIPTKRVDGHIVSVSDGIMYVDGDYAIHAASREAAEQCLDLALSDDSGRSLVSRLNALRERMMVEGWQLELSRLLFSHPIHEDDEGSVMDRCAASLTAALAWLRSLGWSFDEDGRAITAWRDRASHGWVNVGEYLPGYMRVGEWFREHPAGMLHVWLNGAKDQDVYAVSVAGKGEGIEGERSGLWFAMLDAAVRLGCRYVFAENVSAITSRGLDRVLGSLAEVGFDAEWLHLRASDVGAPHRRERWFMLAHRDAVAAAGEPREFRGAPAAESREGIQRQRAGDAARSDGGELADTARAEGARLGQLGEHVPRTGRAGMADAGDMHPNARWEASG